MSAEFIPLTSETLPAAVALLRSFYRRNWDEGLSERIFRWRLIDRPDDEAILAMHGDRCIAMVDSCVRSYIVDNRVMRLRELADWYCLPESRGIGLQPMWMMMRRPEPLVGYGGSEMTRALRPRLKFQAMPQEIGEFFMRLSSRVALAKLAGRLRGGASRAVGTLARYVSVPMSRICTQKPPSEDSSVSTLTELDVLDQLRPNQSDYGIARLVDASELQWLKSAPPEMGEFSALLFSCDQQPIGFSVTRLFSKGAYRAAYILHVQAREVAPQLLAWIIGETATNLAHRGAQELRCLASCPVLADALRETGFRQVRSLQPHWWSRTEPMPIGSAMLPLLISDNGLLPYPPG